MPLNQEELEKQGVYESKAPIASLLADLEQIGLFTVMADMRKKRHRKYGGLTMLGGLIAAVCGVVFAPLIGLGMLAIVVGICWLVYSFFCGGKLVAHPLRLNVATERLKMLQEDASAKAPFALRLALDSKPAKLREEKYAARKNGKQEFYEEAWLSIDGPMLDGTHVSDEVKDLTRKRHFTTARGKSKSKSRTTYLVNVRLTYPATVYGDAQGAQKALHNEIRLGNSAMLRALRVSEKAIVMKAMVSVDKEITPTMGMLSVGGYRILNLARKALASARGGASK